MTFAVIHNGSTHFIIDDIKEIIGVAKIYLSGIGYSAVLLLKNGGRYEFSFPMTDEQFSKIRDSWLLAKIKRDGLDVIVEV